MYAHLIVTHIYFMVRIMRQSFVTTAPPHIYFMVRIMHQSFVTTAPPPTYGDGRGIAGLMCGVVTFRVPPQCRVSAGLVILHKYTPMEFTIIKSRALILSRSPQYRAFSRAFMDEKSLFPLFPVGGGHW